MRISIHVDEELS